MEDKQIIFWEYGRRPSFQANGRRPSFQANWRWSKKKLMMEDNLNFKQIVDDFNVFGNGRQPNFLLTERLCIEGKQPQCISCSNWLS